MPIGSKRPAEKAAPARALTRRRRLRALGAGTCAVVAACLTLPGAAGAAPPTFAITEAGATVDSLSTPGDLAGILLAPGVALDGAATVNGSSDPADFAASLPSFGSFTGGDEDLGIPDGLIVTANASAASFGTASIAPRISTGRTDSDLFGVVSDAGLCTVSASDCVFNATSVEFAVRPTAPYIKFEYALAITESGFWDAGSESWSSAVFNYPDGFALFVGGNAVANNCAVVPQTSTYLTMQTVGIVPPAVAARNSAAAQANLDARILDPGAPNGFAYATGVHDPSASGGVSDPEWAVRFLTVPITCVADVSAAHDAGEATTLKIVVSDVGDNAVPPAVFLKGGSVRFSENSTPTPDPDPMPDPGSPAKPAPKPVPKDPEPPAPVKETPPAPAAPRSAPIATPLAPASYRSLAAGAPRGSQQVVQRLQFDEVGRYTFIYYNVRTGKRIVQLPGSKIGRRTVNRRSSAPVLNNQKPGRRLVLASRFAARTLPARRGDIGLRIVLKRPDGTLSDVALGSDGRLH